MFSNDGCYLDKFDVQGAAFGMEFDNQGNLWTVTNRPAVFKYRISGR